MWSPNFIEFIYYIFAQDDVDDEIADSFDVDGTYVPRIYFLDPDGKIWKDLWNVGTNYLDNKFYFFEVTSSKYFTMKNRVRFRKYFEYFK